MASTVIPFTDASVVHLGPTLTFRSSAFFGEDGYDLDGYGAHAIVTVAPGETAAIRLRSNTAGTTPIAVKINGSTTTPTVTNDGVWQNVTIYNSTSATLNIEISSRTSESPIISADNFLTVTHATLTPAASVTPAYAHVYQVTTETSVRKEDLGTATTFFGFPIHSIAYNDSKLTFKGANPGDIRLFMFKNGSGQSRIAKNGTYSGSATVTPSTTLFGVVSIASGLTGSVGDVWTVHFSAQAGENGANTNAVYLIADTAIDVVDWTTPVRRTVMQQGDSITQCNFALSDDSSKGYVDPAGLGADVTVYSRGIYGSTISTTNGSNPFVADARATTELAAINPDELDILLGTNDLTFGTAEATVKADLKTAVGKCIAAAASLTKIRIHAILPRTDAFESSRASFNTNVLQAAATELQVSNPTLTITYSTDLADAITNTGTDIDVSQVHLTLAGYAKVATAYEATLDAAVVDETPPTVLQTSATNIDAAGTTFTMKFSEAVLGVDDAIDSGDFRLSTGQLLSNATTIDGITWTIDCEVVTSLQSPTLQYFDADGFVYDDPAGNLLLSFSGNLITNNSTVTVPDAPVLTGVTATVSGIIGDLEAGASDGGTEILYYEWWHKRDSAAYVKYREILPANLASFIDRGTLEGEVVKVKAKAVNIVGASAFSAESTVDSAGPPVSHGSTFGVRSPGVF